MADRDHSASIRCSCFECEFAVGRLQSPHVIADVRSTHRDRDTGETLRIVSNHIEADFERVAIPKQFRLYIAGFRRRLLTSVLIRPSLPTLDASRVGAVRYLPLAL